MPLKHICIHELSPLFRQFSITISPSESSMSSIELDEAFGHFIAFGQLFDKPTRAFLVKYLNARLARQDLSAADMAGLSPYFGYFQKALDKILDNHKLFEAVDGSPRLTREMIEDILKWIKKTDRKIQEDNPYYKEKTMLEAWAHKPTFLWKSNWYLVTNFLANEYKREEVDADFYVTKFKEVMPAAPRSIQEQREADKAPIKSKPDIIIDDLLAQWDALFSAKLLQYQAEELEKEGDNFGKLVAAKVEEFLKLKSLIDPFAIEAGNYWDMSRGLWKEASFDLLEKYRELLANEASVQELVDLLGRMRQAEIELEEETYEHVIVKKEWVKDEMLREEAAGLIGSNDLNRMIPAEAALLADAATEDMFYQKFADHSLLSFKYEGKQLKISNKVNFFHQQKQRKKEKGPFILCIDTSGSMHGTPAQIAKVITFAVMKMAAKEQRKCYLISFSIGIKTIDLLDIANSMDKIVDFLSMSFDGGTDVTPALSEALRVLQTHAYKDADVMMVSDFVMFEIRQEILERVKKEQHKGTKFHSLTISKKPNLEVLEAFDHCWVYDSNEKMVMKQLLNDLKHLKDID